MMYWRVRKYSPQDMLKRYGAPIALVISLLVNLFLIVTRPNLNKIITPQVKTDLDAFARKVTQHILDTSYITYEDSTMALMNSESAELAPSVVAELQRQQQLPNDLNGLKATAKTYAAQRRVSAVRIDDISQQEADGRGLVPIDVIGQVAVHSAEESDPGPVGFHFRYLLGFRPNTQTPIVAGFQDLSPAAK